MEQNALCPTGLTGSETVSAEARLDLLTRALNQTETGIHVVDLHTRELYYSNHAGFALLGKTPCAAQGRPCHKVFFDSDTPCAHCLLQKVLAGQTHHEIVLPSGQAFRVVGQISRWNDRDVYIESLTDITGDKLAARRLLESEQYLEAAAGHAGLWYWIFDWRNDTCRLSPRVQRDFGFPEVVPHFIDTWLATGFVHPDHRELFRKSAARLATERQVQLDMKGFLPDGTPHWFRFLVTNLYDDSGVATHAVGTAQIIDNEKELEVKYELEKRRGLRTDDALLGHSLFNLSTGRTLEWDPGMLLPNPDSASTFLQVTNAVADTIISSVWREKYLEFHNLPTLMPRYERGEYEQDMDLRRLLPDGRIRWLRLVTRLMREPNGSDILLFEYCYDVNKQKSLDLMVHFAVKDDYDMLGCVSFRDGQAVMLYGPGSYSPKNGELVECDYNESMHDFAKNGVLPADRDFYLAHADMKAVRIALTERECDEILLRTHGTAGVRIKKIRFTLYKATEDLFLFTQTDVTDLMAREQKKQEELKAALAAAEIASQSKTTFLSQMSHEIRTPMNAIIGMTRLAQNVAQTPETQDYLKKINLSSHYLLGIINDILDMSRIESGRFELHPQWTPAGEMLASCLDMLSVEMERKEIQFIRPGPEHDRNLEFYVDPLRTKQILMNLLNNAIKFTPPYGVITLEIQTEVLDRDRRVDHVTITDTGCGMSPQFLTRIFQPFEQEANPYSGQVQGTGLGLALVKQILTAMGGSISVKSTLGQGSSFCYNLPYRCRTAVQPQMPLVPAAKAAAHLRGMKILLADDHPLNREIASKLLQKQGAHVVQAVDGGQAVELFSASNPGEYDVILMDIRMPVLDGLAATRAIRALHRPDAVTVPIIAMTANAFDEDVRLSLAAGMNDHLAKPIDPVQLYAAIARHTQK